MPRNLILITLFAIAGCAGQDQQKAGKLTLKCADVYNIGQSVCDGPSVAHDGIAPLAVIEETRGDVSRNETVFIYLLFENGTGSSVVHRVEIGVTQMEGCGGDENGNFIGHPDQDVAFLPGLFEYSYGISCGGMPLGAHDMFMNMDGEPHTIVHFNTVE